MARKDIKLPSISRIIHDKNYMSIILGTIFIVIAVTLVGVDLKNNYLLNKSELNQKNNLLVQKMYWNDVLGKYPDYRDGYLALAKVEYQLGENDSSLNLVKKALTIDPNYKNALDFEEILNNN